MRDLFRDNHDTGLGNVSGGVGLQPNDTVTCRVTCTPCTNRTHTPFDLHDLDYGHLVESWLLPAPPPLIHGVEREGN